MVEKNNLNIFFISLIIMAQDNIRGYLEMALEGISRVQIDDVFKNLNSKYAQYKSDFEEIASLVDTYEQAQSIEKLKDVADIIMLEMIDDFKIQDTRFFMVSSILKSKLEYIAKSIDRLLGSDDLANLPIMQGQGLSIPPEETIKSIKRSISEFQQILSGLEG